MSRPSPDRAVSATLVVKGKDLSALMDIIELPGIPFPAMPPSARVLLVLAKYLALWRDPAGHSSILDIPPLPMQADPAAARAATTPMSGAPGRRAGYVFYLDAGPAPGTSTAYWGPEIRVGAPQPALTTNMDAQTNVESALVQLRQRAQDDTDRVFPGADQQGADRHPDTRRSHPLNPPLGLVPPLPPNIKKLDATAHLSAPEALMAGLTYAGQHSDSVFGSGRLDVTRYGRLLKSRKLVGVRGAGVPFDGTLLCEERDATRSSAAPISRVSPWPATAWFRRFRRCRYEHDALYGKYRADGGQQYRPVADRPHSSPGAGCRGLVPSTWAMPEFRWPASIPASSRLPMIGSGVWVEFERGDPDYPIWVGGYWGTAGRGAGIGPCGAARGDRHHLADAAQNGLVISDVPGPTGGILTRPPPARDLGQRCRDYISNGKGAVINMTGPTVDGTSAR